MMGKWMRAYAAVLLLAVAAPAADWKALQPQGYVSDFAGVTDAASRAQLERYCAAVERSTGAQMALVLLPTIEGEPIEDVANTIYRAWGVGRKETDEGIMLLLVTGERRSRLEVGYGLEPYIPDGFAGSVLRQMRPALRGGQYGEALMAAAQTIGERIAQAKGVSIDATLQRRMPREQQREPFPWPVVVGAILLLLFLTRAGARGQRGYYGSGFSGLLTGMLLGHMMGRSTWGSRGSGGFGGFDSSDGFGGFGGGDSGGGGASSDW